MFTITVGSRKFRAFSHQTITIFAQNLCGMAVAYQGSRGRQPRVLTSMRTVINTGLIFDFVCYSHCTRVIVITCNSSIPGGS